MSAKTDLTLKVTIGDTKPPSPGSDAAIERGCICPVMDNARGAGWRYIPGKPRVFVINEGCPLHDEWVHGPEVA